MSEKVLLAILGRGIQKDESGPNGEYVLTEALEVCDPKNLAHLPVRIPADDENPYCMIGGGELNFVAGIILYEQMSPAVSTLVVCAYGDRSEYLKSVNGPTESEVMSAEFKYIHPDASIEIWPSTKEMPGPSNTNMELKNIFELALSHNIKNILIVTVRVHMPRTLVMAQRYLEEKRFRDLNVKFRVSEDVLVEKNIKFYAISEQIRNSKSFARNWQREIEGITKVLRNTYSDEKPPVTA